MITSFIIRYLDWQAHDRLLGQLSAMASIGLSGVLSMAFLDPSAFHRTYSQFGVECKSG
jgi:hypothetical protein